MVNYLPYRNNATTDAHGTTWWALACITSTMCYVPGFNPEKNNNLFIPLKHIYDVIEIYLLTHNKNIIHIICIFFKCYHNKNIKGEIYNDKCKSYIFNRYSCI